ncbi:MAG TPA: M48 family metallopeptidase [Myxococcota bacterium]|nr:M48 family metallopeptidase [Myxococcota bacterium]
MPGRAARSALAAAALAALLALPGCGSLSVQEEQQLGAEMARDARKHLDFVREQVVVGYVEQIGRGLVKAAGPQPFTYHFHVVEDPEVNAFAAPAGYVYVNTGTILAAANASELAGVIAHEVGHVALRHIANNYNKQRGAGILYQLGAVAASIFVPGPGAAAAQLGGQLAAMGVLNSFSRQAESEADAFAVKVMPVAGWNPEGLVSFFKTLQQQTKGGGRPPEFLSSHPATESRIEATSALIREAKLPEDLRESDGGKLEIIQRRIQILTGHASH